MDFLGILSGSENLYKYLFVMGVGMLVLSLFYPLKKQHELQLEVVKYNYEIKVLNLEISKLKEDAVLLDSSTQNTIDKIEKLKIAKLKSSTQKNIIDKKINGIKSDYISSAEKLKRNRFDIELKRAQNSAKLNRIEVLKRHIEEIKWYERLLFWGGLFFILIGFVKWAIIVEKIKWDR